MLYVLNVEAGVMSTFDMNIALHSVANLKEVIERKTKIPSSALVLLVSGGEVLQDEQKVCSYSAGTDTNPIFMFSKMSIKEHIKYFQPQNSDYECALNPIADLSSSMMNATSSLRSSLDMKQLVAGVDHMSPCLATVARCAQLAQQFADAAVEYTRDCQQLVHVQHLQHQGWTAVVANLEDIYKDFCGRSAHFKDSFKKYRQKQAKYQEDLGKLNEIMLELRHIPMLPALRTNAEAFRFTAFDQFDDFYCLGDSHHASDNLESPEAKDADFGAHVMLSNDDVFEAQKSGSGGEASQLKSTDEGVTFEAKSCEEQYTLMDWILARENKASLQDIVDYCNKGLQLMGTDPTQDTEKELYNSLEYANQNSLKNIKGIEHRFCSLEQLILDGKKIKKDQVELANALIQNRERVTAVSDPSVLPTLYNSHRVHLQTMLKNHTALVDIHTRIAKSKDELSHSVKCRLCTVLIIENLMSKLDAHYVLNYQCFSRLERYFDVLQQLHRAPELFVRAVHETVRRKVFSDAFLQWASELSCHLLEIHNGEVLRRQDFNSQFQGHFLGALFPGTQDMPPAYASQAPGDFDAQLPNLTEGDVEFVTQRFPELAKEVNKCSMESVVEFFKSRMGPSSDFGKKDKEITDMVKAGLEGDFVSCEGGANKCHDVSVTCVADTAEADTLTEETMETLNNDVQKMTNCFIQLYKLCRTTIILMNGEITKLRSGVQQMTQFVNIQCSEILKALIKKNEIAANILRQQMQELTFNHELELSDMKKVLNEKDDSISTLHSSIDELKKKHLLEIEIMNKAHEETKEILEKSYEDLKNMEKKIDDMEVQKQKDLKELQDKMHLEYKAELESLRSRFRLVAVTNMDRSPSESSLEKIERTDVIEISSHNAIVLQTKENMEVEKEEAVRQAVASCEREWQQRLDDMKSKHEADKQITLNESVRRIIDEKDRQLEQGREREAVLVRECNKYKETIQQLSDPESCDYETLLKTQMATLENEKAVLASKVEELQRELERRCSEEKELEKTKEDTDSSGKSVSRSSRWRWCRGHTPLGVPAGSLTLSSCLPGHTVLVVWDPAHQSYTVLQESPVMYFVHSDSLAALELSVTVRSESERRLYAVATVENKEYCFARKSGTRYHVPQGFRFFRVRVKPLRPALPPPACCEHRHARRHSSLRGGSLLLCEQRPVKKWLTYLHAPDIQKCQEPNLSMGSATDVRPEVPTSDLIKLSPSPTEPCKPGSESKDRCDMDESTSECMEESTVLPVNSEDQDSLDASAVDWNSRLQLSTRHSEMESSVAPVQEPPHPASPAHPARPAFTPHTPHLLELSVAVVAPDADLLGDDAISEVAEEATP